MSTLCASPEPVKRKTTISNDRLKNAKVIAENAMKVCVISWILAECSGLQIPCHLTSLLLQLVPKYV